MLKEYLLPIRVLLTESIKAWFDHRAASKGAALAFYTLFSITPILVLSIAVAGYFFGVEAAQGRIIGQVEQIVGPNGAQALSALLAASKNPASGLWASVVAGGLLLVGATSVFVELKESLDELWGVCAIQQSGIGGLLKKRLLSFGLVFALTMLLFISLVLSAALAIIEHYATGIWSYAAIMFSTLNDLIAFSVISCLFAVIYKTLPDVPLSWRDVWFGAVFTAAMFSLGRYVIGVYLSHSSVASSFGVAGSLIALLLWVYYSAQIFFLGAEFTRQYALRFGSLKQ